MQDDLTIPLEDISSQRLSFEEASKLPRPITYISTETGALTTISGGLVDLTDARNRPPAPLLRCTGIGTADPATAMGVPAAPTTPFITPSPRARKAQAALRSPRADDEATDIPGRRDQRDHHSELGATKSASKTHCRSP